MKSILTSYMKERMERMERSKIIKEPGPVVTISRSYGCPAKIVAQDLCLAINKKLGLSKNVPHWRWISKEILEMAMEKYPLKGEKDYGIYDNIYTLIDIEIYNVNVSGTTVTTIKPSSFSGSLEVLYVVNGTISSDISFVLPMNVKTIRYVERAGAAKYGSQGANGAIEITLK